MSHVASEEGGECDELGDLDTDFDDECAAGECQSPCPSSFELDHKGRKSLEAEYAEVTREIDNQNKIVNKLKMNIVDKALKPCKTRCDERELQNLRCILERENIKLQCLLRKAVTLQEEDPNKTWAHIPLATTFQEDSMPLQFSATIERKSPCNTPCASQSKKSVSSEKEKNVQALLKRLLSEVKCSKNLVANKENLKQLAQILKSREEPACERKKKRNKRKKSCDGVSKELCRSYEMQDRLATDNSRLEGDRYELQNEVMQRDHTIDCLQNKINLLQTELQSLCKEKNKVLNNCPPLKAEGKQNRKLQSLEKNISTMENCMDKLKFEMNHLQNERAQWENTVSKVNCAVHKKPFANEEIKRPKNDELSDLKDNYAYLLSEYAKKDAELKTVQERGNRPVQTQAKCEDNERAEMDLLREKLADLQDEADEFKCLIREQSEQLVEYQNKYLAAQQKVEEQKCMLNKLEINNKKIEDQINLEIRRIKEKFQEKMKELIQLPQLLENEQLKLAAACKEKENLESKLRLVCRELKTMKSLMEEENGRNEKVDSGKRIRELENELETLHREVDNLRGDKQILCEKFNKTKRDLDMLRTESAKIVSRTKDRAEQTRCALQHRIDCVEKELAQCRATACLSISDREEVIREMQGQLNTIACNFDTAQNQIRTLKGHIAYLSKDSEQCN